MSAGRWDSDLRSRRWARGRLAEPDASHLKERGQNMIRMFTFVGGVTGAWRIVRTDAVIGEPLPEAPRAEVVNSLVASPPPRALWLLRGVISNERYVTRGERQMLVAKRPRLVGRRLSVRRSSRSESRRRGGISLKTRGGKSLRRARNTSRLACDTCPRSRAVCTTAAISASPSTSSPGSSTRQNTRQPLRNS